MEARFSPRVKEVISYSREEASRLGHNYIGTEHLMLGIIREGEGKALTILKSLKVDIDRLRQELEISIQPSAGNKVSMGDLPLLKQTEKAFKVTYLEAKLLKSSIIGTEHLLLAILKDEMCLATQILNKFKITYQVVKEEIEYMKSENPRAEMSGNP
ncbi:MAG: ATP-dependent Clp protease ATP-binding subunit, partial [Flavobacteriales bacterium]|nr:ATP-dependent Clp protease ATP-binding subunit [Flavobacteriales bacterium]